MAFTGCGARTRYSDRRRWILAGRLKHHDTQRKGLDSGEVLPEWVAFQVVYRGGGATSVLSQWIRSVGGIVEMTHKLKAVLVLDAIDRLESPRDADVVRIGWWPQMQLAVWFYA